MNEKIFKAKRLDNGEWFEFNLFDGVSKITWEIYDKNTICQYTGIKIQGKRIFEGDEVADKYGDRHIVEYCPVRHAFVVGKVSPNCFDLEDLTLTGHNIHDRG